MIKIVIRFATLALLFFGVALALAFSSKISRASDAAPGAFCHSIEKVTEFIASNGMTWERVDNADSIERARDIHEIIPPRSARAKGDWLMMIYDQDKLMFGFVTNLVVCDIIKLTPESSRYAKEFILGKSA